MDLDLDSIALQMESMKPIETKKLTNLALIILAMFLIASGCGVLKKKDPNAHLNAAATAIADEKQAKNAATEAVAQLTLNAATEGAPDYLANGARGCQKTMDMVAKGDYSKLVSEAELAGCDFTEVNLFGLNLTQADLRGAILTGANLNAATLIRADMKFANLTKANLRFAVLIQADLTGANLKGADLTGADLRGSNLTKAIITMEQLSLAANYQGAILPDDIANQ